jgi:hypothetical protein
MQCSFINSSDRECISPYKITGGNPYEDGGENRRLIDMGKGFLVKVERNQEKREIQFPSRIIENTNRFIFMSNKVESRKRLSLAYEVLNLFLKKRNFL